MKEEYIKRHRDPERRKQAHPVLYEIMEDTYGVMVYQEDVMKIAHKFANLNFDDADVLRRGMSGKKNLQKDMERIEQKFHENCRKIGHPEQLVKEVWDQIASFAGYAFPKGHSASYAVESYQSLYLKRYFPWNSWWLPSTTAADSMMLKHISRKYANVAGSSTRRTSIKAITPM
jgi:DNA polymerase III alpha subunit